MLAGDTPDLDLGTIPFSPPARFTLYYGVAPTKTAAEAAVAAVGADVSYLTYDQAPGGTQEAIGIFAYKATTPSN